MEGFMLIRKLNSINDAQTIQGQMNLYVYNLGGQDQQKIEVESA